MKAALLLLAVLGTSVAAQDSSPRFVFRDTAESAGLGTALRGIQGHGAAWGDVNGDGWLDLYVGTFHKEGTKPNLLFLGKDGTFQRDEQKAPQISTRATGAVFADLDNDGDLDLYVGSMPQPKNGLVGCALFRNEGGGVLTNTSEGNGACPEAFGARSVAVLDYDGDGLLDLLVGEDPNPGYNGSPTRSSRLFRNMGGLRFEDATKAAGLPSVPGLGVAAADVNNDGWPDVFIASSDGGNVLLVNDGKGKFREAEGSRERFAWPGSGGDNMVCGICFGDVNRDGLLDLVLGQHFEKPWIEPVPNRLFLNRGMRDGDPVFEEVTEAAGLRPLPMKAPHVELQDFDNDGWPDLATTIVKFRGEEVHPVIFRHLGLKDGVPRFEEYALGVNDFPTEEDRKITRSGTMFERILEQKKITYTAPGPSGDYDKDGRLDLFLPSWWPEGRSLLLQNETVGGHFLDVQVKGGKGVNQMGVGARVNVYRAGHIGQAEALLGAREISVGFGYASGQPAVAHFGLGGEKMVDVEVILPHGKGVQTRKGVHANQATTLQFPD